MRGGVASATEIGVGIPFVFHNNGVPRAFDNASGKASPTIAGWGLNDVAANASATQRTARYAGRAEFEYGTSYLGSCIAPWDCNNQPPPVGACASGVNSSANARWLPTLNARRASINVPFDGPTIDYGDSGSPALVFGGTAPGAVPEIAVPDIPHIVGILVGGTELNNQGSPSPAGVPQSITYAPTFVRGTDYRATLKTASGSISVSSTSTETASRT
ncbi:hypothetical protein BH09MYX1_BH09MYX1_66050 [soil metagenome]